MIKREAPVHISNLALMDSDGRPGRVRIVVDGTGRKNPRSGCRRRKEKVMNAPNPLPRPRLQQLYEETVVPEMMKRHGFKKPDGRAASG